MNNYIDSYWGHLAGSSLCELVELFKDKISWPDLLPVHESRDRIFNQWRTFWIFLGQVLSRSQACIEALRKAQAWLWKTEKKISSNTAAYCKSRGRIEQECLDQIDQEIIQQQSRLTSQQLWCGRDVKVVDGSSLSMPDTEENQELYPQPSGQKAGCGFPVMRIVAMFSLATGIMLACRKSSLQNHEVIPWQDMWDCYQEGDVVLADRAYCSFAAYWILSKRNVDCVMRLHQARKENKIVEKYNKNDYLVRWQKGNLSSKPKWMSSEQWEEMPEQITVRYVKIEVDVPGFRTKSLTVATTLLDKDKYPARQLAELYRRRWMAELFLRDIKTTMRMEILRCKTPHMIHKELSIFLIAYNLIRSLIWQAAMLKGIDPYKISFKAAIDTIRHWATIIAMIEEDHKKKKTIEVLIETIAAGKIKTRKKIRREPRAIKRRPNSNYQLLTKPRNQFIEIHHRHCYRRDNKTKMEP